MKSSSSSPRPHQSRKSRRSRTKKADKQVEKTDYGAVKFKQLGGSGVPLITVGSEKMMGFDANRFMELWEKN